MGHSHCSFYLDERMLQWAREEAQGGDSLIYYFISLLIIFLDQLSKWAIVQYMDLYESIPIVKGWFHITSSRNRGAAFGILQNKQWFFIILTLIVILFLIYYIYKIHKAQKLFALSLSFILGGAIGNLIDRITTGEVVDFIDVRIINYPIFNLADSAIVVGVILMIWEMFFSKEAKKDQV